MLQLRSTIMDEATWKSTVAERVRGNLKQCETKPVSQVHQTSNSKLFRCLVQHTYSVSVQAFWLRVFPPFILRLPCCWRWQGQCTLDKNVTKGDTKIQVGISVAACGHDFLYRLNAPEVNTCLCLMPLCNDVGISCNRTVSRKQKRWLQFHAHHRCWQLWACVCGPTHVKCSGRESLDSPEFNHNPNGNLRHPV